VPKKGAKERKPVEKVSFLRVRGWVVLRLVAEKTSEGEKWVDSAGQFVPEKKKSKNQL